MASTGWQCTVGNSNPSVFYVCSEGAAHLHSSDISDFELSLDLHLSDGMKMQVIFSFVLDFVHIYFRLR